MQRFFFFQKENWLCKPGTPVSKLTPTRRRLVRFRPNPHTGAPPFLCLLAVRLLHTHAPLLPAAGAACFCSPHHPAPHRPAIRTDAD